MTSIPIFIDHVAATSIVAGLGWTSIKSALSEHRADVRRSPWGDTPDAVFAVRVTVGVLVAMMAILFSAIWL